MSPAVCVSCMSVLFKHFGLFVTMCFIITSANIVVSTMYQTNIYFFLCRSALCKVFVHNYMQFVGKRLVNSKNENKDRRNYPADIIL